MKSAVLASSCTGVNGFDAFLIPRRHAESGDVASTVPGITTNILCQLSVAAKSTKLADRPRQKKQKTTANTLFLVCRRAKGREGKGRGREFFLGKCIYIFSL